MNLLELHLIINKNAASGNAAKSAELVTDALKKKEQVFHTYVTDYQGHALEITESLLKKTLKPWSEKEIEGPFPLLVVLGGDGTLHEVINALGDQLAIPVAYIPCGSGNDFARGISLSRDPLVALEHLLATNQPQNFHVLHYQEAIAEESGFAANNIGIGVDAAIVAQASHSTSKHTLNKLKMGSMTYLFAAITVLAKQQGFPILVEINGQEIPFEKAYLCTTTNHPFFGGGVAIAPQADPKKAELELIIVERIAFLKIIHLVTKLLRRTHLTSKHVHHYKSTTIRIVSTTSQSGQADGELLGERPFDVTFATKERLFWL